MSFAELVGQQARVATEPNEFVISLDGGGVRCIMQLVILERLMAIFPQLLDKITLIAGTSGGSFLGLALAKGDMGLARQLFSKPNVEAIFSRTWTECLSHGWGAWRPKYDPSELERVLTEGFGNAQLSSLSKRVLITSFDLTGQVNESNPMHHNYGVQHWSPRFYDNFTTRADQSLVEIALRSSAAPCYFPSHAQFVDGGVVANNPSAHAVTRLVKHGASLDRIVLLSLGSSNNPFHVQPQQSEYWGFVQWAPLLLNLVMDAPSEAAVVMTQELLGDRYHRCNPILPSEIALDDTSSFEQLEQLATTCNILPTIDFLYHHFFPDIPPIIHVSIDV